MLQRSRNTASSASSTSRTTSNTEREDVLSMLGATAKIEELRVTKTLPVVMAISDK
jgi:hypothetical protein